MINAEPGKEVEVMKDLKKVKAVKEASMVYGEYDIVARIETETPQDLKDVVNWRLRQIPSIRSTLTLIAQ